MSTDLGFVFENFSLYLPLGWEVPMIESSVIYTVELLHLSSAERLFFFWINRQVRLVYDSYIYVLCIVRSHSWFKLRNSRLFVVCWLCSFTNCFVSEFSPQNSFLEYCGTRINMINMLHWTCSFRTSRSLSFNLMIVFLTIAMAWNLQFLRLVDF